MKDTGEVSWHSEEWEWCLWADVFTGERKYISSLCSDDSEKSNELFRWYKPKGRDIFWSLSLLKPQLIFSIRPTYKFLAVNHQGRRKSEKQPHNPLCWLLLLTTYLSFFSIYNTHVILLKLSATLRVGRQFSVPLFWAQSISHNTLESNEVKWWPCCDPEYNESHYARCCGGVKTHASL